MKVKYLGREVTIKRKSISFYFPDASIFVCDVLLWKRMKLKHVPKLLKLFVMPHSYLEKQFMNE